MTGLVQIDQMIKYINQPKGSSFKLVTFIQIIKQYEMIGLLFLFGGFSAVFLSETVLPFLYFRFHIFLLLNQIFLFFFRFLNFFLQNVNQFVKILMRGKDILMVHIISNS